MDSDTSTDLGPSVYRQTDSRFRSPGIMRKSTGKEAVIDRAYKKSRRAKSSEPQPLDVQHQLEKCNENSSICTETVEPQLTDNNVGKRWSMIAKSQDNMSKSEMINCYRLLMDEKLRLERFLSIISKHHEMARNRLESDLLDAMMCIEDLKQALEVRMARRRRVDPREAEERRYLIRQNKKLLNQLYESAKKIEHLEVTKVEMKEQLELLDFQILEVENQKTLMEEELRKRPLLDNQTTQTEECLMRDSLSDQLSQLQSELATQRAETAASISRQRHLDNLVRELRRDNVELRDQLAKMEDVEDSLAESDKPIAAATIELQSRVQELETKLHASQDHSAELEARLTSLVQLSQRLIMDSSDPEAVQAAMYRSEQPSTVFHGPNTNDRLLHEAIHTFHTLISERDQEIIQLRSQLKSQSDGSSSVSNAEAQTDQVDDLSADQVATLERELLRCGPDESVPIGTPRFNRLLHMIDRLHQQLKNLSITEPENNEVMKSSTAVDNSFNQPMDAQQHVNDLPDQLEKLKIELTRLQSGPQFSDVNAESVPKTTEHSAKENGSADISARSPDYYTAQLEHLRQLNQLELTQSQLSLSERRRHDLETRLTEMTDQLSRTQAELRTTEASLSAARRTEAALRRRLLAAMDVQGAQLLMAESNSRHSLGAQLGSNSDKRDTMELQAALLKAEATNTSLLESAQLDRARLHEQAVRIGQFEAERRALLDRVCMLQATEANAQRGIVRLQALYEDMLREYSESRAQELHWRNRERSRLASKNTMNGIEPE